MPHPAARRARGRARHAGRRRSPTTAPWPGAIELYRTAGKAGIKPLLGCEIYLVDDRRAKRALEPPRLGAPHAAGRDDRGLPQPDQALHARLPRGLLLQAARRLRAARAATPTASSRSPAASRGAPARRCSRATSRGRARSSTGSCRSSGARTSTSSSRTPASTSTGSVNPGLLALAAETGLPLVGTGDVHYLRAEDATRTRRCSASRRTTCSRTPSASASRPRSSTSRPPTR